MRKLVLPIAILLAALGASTVILLSARADQSRQAQVALAQLQASFNDLQSAGVNAIVPTLGPSGDKLSPSSFRAYVAKSAQAVDPVRDAVGQLSTYAPVEGTDTLKHAIAANLAAHAVLSAYLGGERTTISVAALPPRLVELYSSVSATANAVGDAAAEVNSAYSDRAETARVEEIVGASVVIAVLLAAFAFYFRRSRKLHDDVERLLEESRTEATTDVLTGLRNRRALEQDLAAAIADQKPGEDVLVLLYDLDGFKNYNDTFGHPAGDALLARLGASLRRATEGVATAYRMGGDEFCLLARCTRSDGARLAQQGAEMLVEEGEGFSITASFGAAYVPSEAADAPEALRLADQRLYGFKAQRRPSAAVEAAAVLTMALTEHGCDLDRHTSDVAELARATALALELSDTEVERIAAAGALHDIGKLGIPQSILEKRTPLEDEEWEFIRRHTLIGERIVGAAPSLAGLAPLVRSSHEHFDGAGYPDRLGGAEIPIGARIIAVCDAYDAMTSERPYAAALTQAEAVAELERCAGTQFDPEIVRAFMTVLAARGVAASAA